MAGLAFPRRRSIALDDAPVDATKLTGPAGHPLWGHLPNMTREPLAFLERCRREYGDVVPIRLINVRVLMINHPVLAERALTTSQDILEKPPVFKRNRMVSGQGMFTINGERWRRQRHLAQPAFTRGHLAGYAPEMVGAAVDAVAGWRGGQNVDVHEEMTRVTVTALARALFGVSVVKDLDQIVAAVTTIVNAFAARLSHYYVIPERFPTPTNRRLLAATRDLEGVLRRVVGERRASGQERDDLLAIYLRALDERVEWMDETVLRDELMTFLIAGHETTALALTWAWHLLSRHPEVERALHAEIDEVLGGREPAMDDRPRLRFTEAVLQEALRLYPPIWVYARVATKAVTIGDLAVPRGRRIGISPWVIQRDPRFYDQPDEFDPARWLDGRAANLPRYAFLPFGGGPRACIGMGFAMLEGVLLLAAIGQRVRFVAADREIPVRPSLTLRPRDGVPATIERR